MNIDGGAAADPETGMLYVGGRRGLSTIEVQKDPCSEHRYSQPHNSCGQLGALPPPPGYTRSGRPSGADGFGARVANDDRRRLDRQAEGARRHHGVQHEHRRQEVVDAERRPSGASQTSNDPLFAGVTLPQVPAPAARRRSSRRRRSSSTARAAAAARRRSRRRAGGRGGAVDAPVAAVRRRSRSSTRSTRRRASRSAP